MASQELLEGALQSRPPGGYSRSKAVATSRGSPADRNTDPRPTLPSQILSTGVNSIPSLFTRRQKPELLDAYFSNKVLLNPQLLTFAGYKCLRLEEL